jgi:hypothetical protein
VRVCARTLTAVLRHLVNQFDGLLEKPVDEAELKAADLKISG